MGIFNNRFFSLYNVSKKKRAIGSSVVLVSSLVLIALGQNCSSKSGFVSGDSSSTALSLTEEDDIWFRLESARIKIKQLRAISNFSDDVSNQVLEGKSPSTLANQLEKDANLLEAMLKEQKLASNSSDVIKKYTSLVDLLSNARDMLLAFYMNQGFAQAAANLEEAKSNLANSLDLLSGSLDGLKLAHDKLQSQVNSQGQQLTQMEKDFMNAMNALEAKMDKKVQDVQNEINHTISELNKEMSTRIATNDAAIAAVNGKVVDVDARVKDIEQKLKPQVEYLIQLAEKTRKDLDLFAAQFEELRASGSASYEAMIKGWNCSEDLIDKNGAELMNLPVSVSEACVLNKEETLFKICVERYPTFCGKCTGKTMASCDHWNNPTTGLSPMEKLEILINMRQEITIDYLTQQTSIHKEALFGNASCKHECLTLSNGKLPSSCTVADLNQCGVEGKLISLQITDLNLTNSLLTMSSDVDSRIKALDNDFKAARDYSNQRFASLQSYVDENLTAMKAVTEQKFTSIVNALSGMPVVSKPLFDEMTNACLISSKASAQASASKTLITSALNTVPGWNSLSAEAIYKNLEVDIEDVLRVTSQSSVSDVGAGSLADIMVELQKQVFTALNMDQMNIPEYDAALAAKIANACADNLKLKSPFTNVVGRDPMEIIAIGVARRVLMGDGAASVGGTKTIFDKYQTPIIKGSLLQQAFFSSVLDYRKDISVNASSSCLSAIDDYSKMVLSSSTLKVRANEGTVVGALSSGAIQGVLLNLSEQAKLISDKLASMEATIIQRAVVASNDDTLKVAIQKVALRLIESATLNAMALITGSECSALTTAYREIVPSSGQTAFDMGLQEYIKQKNALAAQNAESFAKLNDQIAALQASDASQNQKIKDLQTAVGSLPTMAAVQAAIDALNIPGIKAQIDALNKKVSEISIVDDFVPRITAVRHMFDVGSTACNSNQLSALAFPTSDQFNGGYLACGVNFRVVTGNGQQYYQYGSNASPKFWLKMWGAATKIDVRVLSNSIEVASMAGSYSGLDLNTTRTEANVNLRMPAGTTKDGAFMMNMPTLMGGFANYGYGSYNPTFKITPYNVPANKTGASVNYTFTLYSPLVLSFNTSEELSTLSIAEGVKFDLMSKGSLQSTGWVSPTQGGLLAIDLNKNGIIDGGAELFGQATKLEDGREAVNGFEALAQYDSNGDNVIDAQDPVYQDLKVWFDLKSDGKSNSRELASLSKMKVDKISLEYNELDKKSQDSNGNKVLYKAKFFGPKACGDQGCTVFDVFFDNARIH